MIRPLPLFIFSLPRSGSTLLQRLLTSHPAVSSSSETWILIPFCYTLRQKGLFAQYSHVSITNAMKGILRQLPNGRRDYLQALRSFALQIYRGLAAEDTTYFIDKTPRYYLILSEIKEMFPDAKFIFLFRNPLSVVSSVIESFNKGRLGDYRHKIDLEFGPGALARGYAQFQPDGIALQYEQLVLDPQTELKRICDYLELDFSPEMLSGFSNVHFKGIMGDGIGTKRYQTVAQAPLEKWRRVLGTRVRKGYARRYIGRIGGDVWKALGYSERQLLNDIDSLQIEGQSSLRSTLTDVLDLIRCEVYSAMEIPAWKKMIKNRLRYGRSPYIHF